MKLHSSYLGLPLRSPLVASCSPLTGKIATLRELEDAGAGAVVLPSLFEEQLQQEAAYMEHFLQVGSESSPEALGYFPDAALFEHKRDRTLELLQSAKTAIDIPVIASLNGVHAEGWASYARALTDAGADALELNLYEVAADPRVSGADVEKSQVETLRTVCAAVSLPVAVKVGPYYSSFAHMASLFQEAGASALVLFNRFYQPDFDIEARRTLRRLGLSESREMLLPLSWIAILRSQLRCNLAATTGVQQARDVVKYLMAGADVVMTTSSLLKHGAGHLRTLHEELWQWMTEHGYTSLGELRGCMQREHSDNPSLFERANYIHLLEGFETPTTRS